DGGGAERRDRSPHASGATGRCGAMYILFSGIWKVEVDDRGQVGDVDAARCHVGADEETEFAISGTRHDSLTVALAQISIEPLRSETPFLKCLRDALRFVFR